MHHWIISFDSNFLPGPRIAAAPRRPGVNYYSCAAELHCAFPRRRLFTPARSAVTARPHGKRESPTLANELHCSACVLKRSVLQYCTLRGMHLDVMAFKAFEPHQKVTWRPVTGYYKP